MANAVGFNNCSITRPQDTNYSVQVDFKIILDRVSGDKNDFYQHFAYVYLEASSDGNKWDEHTELNEDKTPHVQGSVAETYVKDITFRDIKLNKKYKFLRLRMNVLYYTNGEFDEHTETIYSDKIAVADYRTQFIVTYNGNGGTYNNTASFSDIANYDSDYNIRNNVFIKKGYKFLGWSEDATKTVETYNSSDPWYDWAGKTWHWSGSSYKRDVELYAIWDKAIEYEIRLYPQIYTTSANGGEEPISTIQAIDGWPIGEDLIDLTQDNITKAIPGDYREFKGWYTTDNDTLEGIQISKETTEPPYDILNEDEKGYYLNLYARWWYYIDVNAVQGATWLPSLVDVHSDVYVIVKDFKGNIINKKTSNVYYHAFPNKSTYSITSISTSDIYNLNKNTIAQEQYYDDSVEDYIERKYDNVKIISENDDEYRVSGIDGKIEGHAVKPTIYFRLKTGNVQFGPNGGKLNPTEGSKLNGGDRLYPQITTVAYPDLSGDIPIRLGYKFTGWYTADNVQLYYANGLAYKIVDGKKVYLTGNGKYRDPEGRWLYLETFVLYARWEEDEHAKITNIQFEYQTASREYYGYLDNRYMKNHNSNVWIYFSCNYITDNISLNINGTQIGKSENLQNIEGNNYKVCFKNISIESDNISLSIFVDEFESDESEEIQSIYSDNQFNVYLGNENDQYNFYNCITRVYQNNNWITCDIPKI